MKNQIIPKLTIVGAGPGDAELITLKAIKALKSADVVLYDALVNEEEWLQTRINQLFDRIEASLKQCIRIAETTTGVKAEPEARANLMVCYVIGRWHQYAKSGFKRKPTEFVQQQLITIV